MIACIVRSPFMRNRGPTRRPLLTARAAALLAGFGGALGAWGVAGAQPADGEAPPPAAADRLPLAATLAPFEDRLIREIRIQGLDKVNEQLVRNQLRSATGRPMKVETVTGDVGRLVRLGRFKEVTASVQGFEDRSVALTYVVVETPVVKDVQVAGNRQVSDQEIAAEVNILAGTPVDKFQIDRALRKIKDLYLKKGYYQADVTVDEQELSESQILLFRIREGERLRVTDIRFDGNTAFSAGELRRNVETQVWNIFSTANLDDTVLDQDIANLVSYYKDRGYLDVRVDRNIRPSPDGKEAIITFIIEEGPVYTLRAVRAEIDGGGGLSTGKPPVVFSQEQLAGLMLIKAGDAYSQDKIRTSIEAVVDAYGKLGYADARINKAELRDGSKPEVELLLLVTEGRKYMTGEVIITGNSTTRQQVVRRQVRVYPDRPLDAVGIRDSERALREINLFAGSRNDGPPPKITVQDERPEDPGYRDVLVEVKEANTGSISFGAAISSDSGLIGQIVLKQDNFDVSDFPDSFDELIRGQAFKGAGQQFSLAIQPGTEVQNYSVGIADPYLFETDYTGSAKFDYFVRDYDDYDDSRLGGTIAVGRRFGERWSGSLTLRAQQIYIGDVDDDAIIDIQETKGTNVLTGLGFRLRRSTLDSNVRPSRGTRLDLFVERVGIFGGDYQFTKLGASINSFFTLHEDLVNRKTVLNLRSSMDYAPEGTDEVPIFERYFLGGRSFRGFEFRGVSPRGYKESSIPGDPPVKTDDPAGGTFSFFAGAEVEQPLVSDIISCVVFVDSGTVDDEFGLEDYRISVGAGIRLYIQQLGPVPLAFDLGFPLLKVDGDQEQVFTFSIDVPF